MVLKEDLGSSTGSTDPVDGLVYSKVWDLPTRLFHWALAAVVITGWYLGYYREFSTIDYHFYLGYATGGLLVFRLIWGIIGPPSARFSNIVPGPRRLVTYIASITKRRPSGVAGHNPLGGLSVVALLAVLTVQVLAGLFAEDDSLFASGPLESYVSLRWTAFANEVHYISSRILLVLVGLHLTAILFYQVWKRENLITPMLTGWKRVYGRNL
ncbi:MAG: cytochrome b/b6 domain-containing protein [Pseudomonadota bacterium]